MPCKEDVSPHVQRVGLLGLLSKHPGRNWGGSAVSIRRLANSLASSGFKVSVYTKPLDQNHVLATTLDKALWHYELTGQHRIVQIWQLLMLLYRHKIQALLAFDTRANHVACKVKTLLPYPIRFYALFRNALTESRDGSPTMLSSRQKRRLRNIYRRSECILANSNGLANQISNLLGEREPNIGVLPNGVLDDCFWPRSQEPVNHPWLKDGKHPVILGVGRLSRQKDWPTLLRAFTILRRDMPCRLIILGKGELKEELVSLVHQLDIQADVDFPGFVTNPLPWMKQASAFALSSIHEGLPNVLIEAMALGTPAVATDCPFGPAEVIERLGNGILVPVGDSERMSQALQDVLCRTWLQPSSESLKIFRSSTETSTLLSWLTSSGSHS